MKKKFLTAILSAICICMVVFSLAGCSKSDEEQLVAAKKSFNNWTASIEMSVEDSEISQTITLAVNKNVGKLFAEASNGTTALINYKEKSGEVYRKRGELDWEVCNKVSSEKLLEAIADDMNCIDFAKLVNLLNLNDFDKKDGVFVAKANALANFSTQLGKNVTDVDFTLQGGKIKTLNVTSVNALLKEESFSASFSDHGKTVITTP